MSQLPVGNFYSVLENECPVIPTDWYFGFQGLFNHSSLLRPPLWDRGLQSPIKFGYPDHMYIASNPHNLEAWIETKLFTKTKTGLCSLQGPWSLVFFSVQHAHTCSCVKTPQPACEDQKTTYKTQFSPFLCESRIPTQVVRLGQQASLLGEPSCQPRRQCF